MAVLGVHHVSLTVADVDEAVRFYTGSLGARMLDRPDFGFPGAWLSFGDQQVHLIEGDPPPERGQHVALRVVDVDALVADLTAQGVRADPVPHVVGAGRQAFLRDPSGNVIELNQPDAT